MQFKHFALSATWVCVTLLQSTAEAADRLVPQQYATIQAAIDAAANGDVVQISPGSYQGPIDTKGKAITVRGTADAAATVVSGGQNVLSCVTNEGASTVIERLTLSNGSRGIMINDSSPTVRQCRILMNSPVESYGAGICVFGGSPLIQQCLIAANTLGGTASTSGLGAGVYLWNCTATLSDCLITGNLIEAANQNFGAAVGAGVYVTGLAWGAPVTLERCTIASNQNASFTCSGSAGTGVAFFGPATVTDCVVRENTGPSSCSGTSLGAVHFGTNAVFVRGTRVCGNTGGPQTSGAFVNLGGNTISATCPVTCPGDLNSDGYVDGDDLGRLLSNWGPCTN